MRILITGSSGHLGEALARTLRNTNHEVIGIDLIPSRFTNVVGSIIDRDFVMRCMKDVQVVMHTATLHKPHLFTHTAQNFIDTNITGTLNLLEQATQTNVHSFIFTSTTSAFGYAHTPTNNSPAVWVTEDLRPIPKNIYGVTKSAAEDLCELFNRNHGLPCIVLRTSRFFPEEDDREEIRRDYEDANVKANEFLYRRVDVEDVVNAHLLAMQKAKEIGFNRYIVSATSPFTEQDLHDLRTNAPAVVKKLFPDFEQIYADRGWRMFPDIDRVYVNQRARQDLGWNPKYDFRKILDELKLGNDPRSLLAGEIGSKGYHSMRIEQTPYPSK
ncbi:MAG TPA: NAD(P)-dependent oxidoreductase [Acidobacteriota bacterium]|nr:NAD(P)-dependent oxidoreductase [Acidobacteriota bacterium]